MSTSTATIVSAPSTDAPAAATVTLPIKWDHYGEIRRFSIPVIAGGDAYIALMEKIYALRPDFQGDLAWNDEEGDLILLSSAEELKEAMALTKDGQLLKVFSAGDVEKEGEDEVIVIDDEEEEKESADEPVVQFSSDETNGCRKMKKRMAKSCNKGCTKGCTKGYKKEAKKMMKMMGGRGMGCCGMGCHGMGMAEMGQRGMGHRGMGMGHRGMGMGHRGMGMGPRGMGHWGMGHRGMGMGHRGMGMSHRGMGHRGMCHHEMRMC